MAASRNEHWQIWFYDPGPDHELQGGVLTVDSQLRASMRRLAWVEVRQKTLEDLESFVVSPQRFVDERIALISHVDALSVDELERLAVITKALRAHAVRRGEATRPVHFAFIHRDPTGSFSGPRYANDAESTLLERIVRFEASFDQLVCVGPRMFAHLTSRWPAWRNGRLLQLGAGMLDRPPLAHDDSPMLRPMPRKSNVRVLFGSPTTPRTMDQRGLDVFAKAAGLVQSHFVDRHVDVTFVVSGIEPDRDSTPQLGDPSVSDIDSGELVEIVERRLVDYAREVFDGNTDFEVRPQQDRTAWLRQELERADIFVLPSRDEPFGLVAAEALSKGKPVILSQNSGIGEALLDVAADSFLPIEKYVCPLTPSALAGAIARVIEDDRSRRLFHRIARQAYPRLSWSNAVHQLLNALDLDEAAYKPTIEVTEAGAERIRRQVPGADWQESTILPIDGHMQKGGVRFNMPVTPPSVIEEFDTNAGRRVTLESSGSVLFVRKVGAEVALDGRTAISDTKLHWAFVRRELTSKVVDPGVADIYPRLHHVEAEDQLVMEYIDGGSLDRVAAADEAARLARLATVQLLWTARTLDVPNEGPSVWQFCRDEFRLRRDRLQRAIGQLDADDQRRLGVGQDLIETCEKFIAAREAAVQADPPTPISVHGDFMLNNIVYKSDTLRGDRIVFIDTRARWDDLQRPRWDPAFDLASFYVFTMHIQPVLAREFGFGVHSPLHGAAPVAMQIIEGAVADSDYESIDTGWRARVEAACVVRLLGGISAQLTSARFNRLDRAARIVDLTQEFVSWQRPINWVGRR